jgi:predicted dehydrogenase
MTTSLETPLSIGVPGAGNVVFENHLPVLSALGGVKLTWIGDTNHKRCQVVADAYGMECLDMGATAARLPPVDVLLIAIPYGARRPYYEMLHNKSKDTALYIEKPVAKTVEEHRQILRPYRDFQVTCGYYRRASALLGEVSAITEQQLFGQLREIYAGIGGLGAQGVGGGYKSNLALAGGGLLFESGVHIIDSVLFSVGATEARVKDVKMELDEGFDLHTDARLVVTMPGGAAVEMHLMVSNLSAPKNGVEFHFDHAVIRFNVFGGPEISVSGRHGHAKKFFSLAALMRGQATTSYKCLGVYWTDFLDGIRARSPNYTAGVRAMLTTQVVEELYQKGGA